MLGEEEKLESHCGLLVMIDPRGKYRPIGTLRSPLFFSVLCSFAVFFGTLNSGPKRVHLDESAVIAKTREKKLPKGFANEEVNVETGSKILIL